MRRDIRVPNESDGFVFTSASLRGRGISPGESAWTAGVEAGELLPLAVESEDPANVRVVVAEPLTAEEQEEWVGVVRGGLRIPDGRLVLGGGIEFVLETGPLADERTRTVEVPPGDYRASLYCYASAPNGRQCVDRSGSDEPLGAWFRRTRPGAPMPTWLHNLCVNDPDLDPGHELQWKRAKEKKGDEVVDLLLHLEPHPIDRVLAPGADGFLVAAECRQPQPFPLGLQVSGPAAAKPSRIAAPRASPTAKSAVPAGELQEIVGGPVAVPVVKLARVAYLAWMCQPYANPSLRITFPTLVPHLADVESARSRVIGNELEITFDGRGQPAGALAPLTAVAKQLATLADGAVMELETTRTKPKDRAGLHRYRGAVRDGQWQIEAASPAVDAKSVSEALALCESLEDGRRMVARDEEEADRIEGRLRKVMADYFGTNPLQRTGAELALKRRDPALWAHVLSRVFWMRYPAVWPLQDGDAD